MAGSWRIEFESNYNTYISAYTLEATLYLGQASLDTYYFDDYDDDDSSVATKKCVECFQQSLKDSGYDLDAEESKIMFQQIHDSFSAYENGEHNKFRKQNFSGRSAVVQKILNNQCYFAPFAIDSFLSKIAQGTKKLIPGYDKVTKNINFITDTGEKYYAKISRIEILEKATEKELETVFGAVNDNIILVFETASKKSAVAVLIGYIGSTSETRTLSYYDFNTCETFTIDTTPAAIFTLSDFTWYYDTSSPLAHKLIPVMNYYNQQLSELNQKSENIKVRVNMGLLRKNFDIFQNLAVDDNLLIVPVLGKPTRIKSLTILIENADGKISEYDFYDATLSLISKDDKALYKEYLDEEGISLGKEELVLLDLINVSDKDLYLFKKIFTSENNLGCTITTNTKGDKVRLDRVIRGITNALTENVDNSTLVELICSNDISYIDYANHFMDYSRDEEYIDLLKKQYPVLEKNDEQLMAVDKIMQMDKNDIDVMLVQGPPGTGKTELILALAKELYKAKYNTLITSNVHVACDNIVDRLKNNKDLVLKRYTSVWGEQYLNELTENKKKYVENQVLEGFKFNDIIIDSSDKYEKINAIVDEEREHKEQIYATKAQYDENLRLYRELLDLKQNLEKKQKEILEEIHSFDAEIKSYKSEKESVSEDLKVLSEDYEKNKKLLNASKGKVQELSQEFDRKTELLNDLYKAVSECEVLIQNNESSYKKIGDEVSQLNAVVEEKKQYYSFLKSIELNNVKSDVIAYAINNSPLNHSYYEKLIPITLKKVEELVKIYSMLQKDADFWSGTANASFKTIEFCYFNSMNPGVLQDCMDANSIKILAELYEFLKSSSTRQSVMSVLPFVKFNGHNKAYYEKCLTQVNTQVKKIQFNYKDLISVYLNNELSDDIVSKLLEKTIYEINELKGIIDSKIDQMHSILSANGQAKEKIDVTNQQIPVAANDSWRVKGDLDRSTEDVERLVANLEALKANISEQEITLNNIIEKIDESQSKYDSSISAEQNIRAQIEENKRNLQAEYNDKKDSIENYDSFVAKMNIDISEADKKIKKYQAIIELFNGKICELTSVGWDKEEAQNLIFDYADELSKIAECDSAKVEKSFFCGRGNEFDKMFSITDNRDGSLISMTTNQIASLLKSAENKDLTFDYAIIDEASKCRFEDLIISLPKIKHLVLIGDFMQLDPMYDNYMNLDLTYQNMFTSEAWETLNRSSFSLLLSQFVEHNVESGIKTFDLNPYVAVLKRQYRMNKGIFNLIEPVYSIHDGFELIDEKQTTANDVKCINIHGNEEPSGTSQMNIDEAEAIISFMKEFKANREKYPNIKTIGIITGYKAQENYIRRRLKDVKIKGVQLGTFDRFQGREYDLVIVSLVRTEKLGFTNNVRRMNVAFSRAKNHLIVLGNFDALNKISLRNTKYSDDEMPNTDKKESEFVVQTLIPKLYRLREDFVSDEERVESIMEFLKENDYE